MSASITRRCIGSTAGSGGGPAPGKGAISPPALHPVAGEAAWRELLAYLPYRHPLQSWAWGSFKGRWGWQPRWLALAGDGGPAGAALVLRRRLRPLSFTILYVPKGPCLDAADAPSVERMLDALEALARRERALFVKIDPDLPLSCGLDEPVDSPPGVAFRDRLAARGWRFSADQIQFRNTVLLDLAPDEDALLAAMKQKTRYNIRLAARRGVTVRAGGPADFDLLAAMYAETAARDGFAIRPAAYYQDAWQTFADAGMGHLLLAEFDGRPLAAVFLVSDGERAIYMYGASTDEERQRMPNYLLQWEAIRWARAQGCTTYDFWGAPDTFDERDRLWGVWRFKAGFEGRVVRHLGAWDYAPRPLLYHLYAVLMPRYLDWLRARAPE